MRITPTFSVSYGTTQVAPPLPEYAAVSSFAMAHPMVDATLERARLALEDGLQREVGIAQAPITSSAGYAEARRVAATVRARIEGMRILGALPPGPALSAALGVLTAVTTRVREWEATQDMKLVSARKRSRSAAVLPALTDAMKEGRRCR